MKVKTNVRAGKQNRGAVKSTGPEVEVETVSVVYYPPVNRCPGI